ncbi:HMG box domain-containing protein [Psidium guajava]|nr:HMG box domain-containing protein [Psidium guajava]
MSLLYHFEQVYYFHRQAPSLVAADPESGNEFEGSVFQNNGASTSFVSSQGDDLVTLFCAGNLKLQPGSSVTGFIDGKFDNGYLVSVNLGNQELKGVLYHIPQVMHMSQSALPSEVPTRRKRRRSRMKLRDPFRPKSNRSGYNFFFAEHYARLKPQYYGRERAISKKIGYLWNNLTEAEKQVYQEKGVRDKERYKSEMQEYRSSQGLNVSKV